MISQFSCRNLHQVFFQVSKMIAFCCCSDFEESQNFWKTCFVDGLKEILLIINVIVLAVTQKLCVSCMDSHIIMFVVTQHTFAKTLFYPNDFFIRISPSQQIDHPRVAAISITLSFLISRTSIFLSSIHHFLHLFHVTFAFFSISFCLANKTNHLPFHEYIALP